MADESDSEASVLCTFVDYLLPLLRPYEASIYLYLLRRTRLERAPSTRVGVRTISRECGLGTRSASGGNQQHIREVLRALEAKGCLMVGDRSRHGTLYTIRLPSEVDAARERMLNRSERPRTQDYIRDAQLRRTLFERDDWTCRYCGDPVSEESATLDHLVPSLKRGAHTPDNLATACLLCNSLKAGRSYEEAAPLILAFVRERRLAQA
jgi:hypothetical protein